MRVTLPPGMDRLSDRDRETLSTLTVDHILPILAEYREQGATFALIVPISFSAVSVLRPRLALLNRCAPFKDIMQRAVIAELTDLDSGIPSGLIRETAAMIKPFFRVITATVRTTSDVTTAYREAAFHGIAVNWRGQQSAELPVILRLASRRTRNLIVHGVPADILTDVLRGYGASHLTWRD